jgi:hypothetical protein
MGEAGMKRALVLALGLIAAACVQQPQTNRQLEQIGRDYQRQSAEEQRETRANEQDTCGLAQHQDLIGKSQSEFQTPSNARIICMGCMATMDFNASRLTIQMGPDHKVASLRCG